MAKVRNAWGYAVEDVWGGRMVEDEAVIEVPDDRYESYVLQPGWEPVEEPVEESKPRRGKGVQQ